jgi:hypothetical protein
VLKAGDRIGDWVVDSVLGEGGMGAVYRVHSALTDRLEAALKVMKPTIAEDARRRFVREAEALSALRHPAIVRVMGFSEDPARHLLYLVMELAVGETLKDRLGRGPMPLPEALATFVPLAAALDHAHQSGIFHRDLKPANVVLCNDGTPRLVDFGIAAGGDGHTLTGAGQMGTLAYLPPEVFRGQTAGPQSIDVYAFGLLLHEALTGQRAYAVEPGLTPAAAAAAVGVRKLSQAGHELPPAFPQALRDVVAGATNPDPASRPTMGKVRETLQSLVDRRARPAPAGARTPTSPYIPTAPPPVPPRPAAPPVERTMRVPDPPAPPVGRPALPGDGGRGLKIAAIIVGLLVVAGLVATIGVGRRSDGDPLRKVGTASPAPARRAAPAPNLAARTPPPMFIAPSPAPSAAAAQPITLPPAPVPSPTPLAAGGVPSRSPSPAPTRPPVTLGPPTPLPSPVVVRPEVLVEEPPPGDEGPVERIPPSPGAPAGGNVSGTWELSNRVVSTDFDGYRGLSLGYSLTLRQEGSRIVGSGVKVTENGAPVGTRTPISVSGRIAGSSVVLSFTEVGAARTSAGTFRWRLSPDGTLLAGTFRSDVANANGPSSARRVQ